jgi:hypothetical protein
MNSLIDFTISASIQDPFGVSMTYMEFVGFCNIHVIAE